MRLLLLSSTFALTLGCAGTPILTCPEKGGPPWIELRSQHLVLHTDLDEADGKARLAEFEQSYGAFEDIAFPYEPKPGGVIHLVVFADPSAYKQFASPDAAGHFIRQTSLQELAPTLVFSSGQGAEVRAIFQHELSHRFSAHYFPASPAWLNEGMADFHATLRLTDGEVHLGRPSSNRTFTREPDWLAVPHERRRVLAVPIRALPAVDALLSLDYAGFYAYDGADSTSRDARRRRAANYAAAWALVHVLELGDVPLRTRFLRYLEALNVATRSPDQAFRDAFGDLPAGALQRAFDAFVQQDETSFAAQPYRPRTPETERTGTMQDSDVHLLWARLRRWNEAAAARAAAADLDEAVLLAEADPEPHLARGTFRLVTRDNAGALRDLARAAALASDDPRYLYPLAALRTRIEAALPPEQRAWGPVEALVGTLEPRATTTRQLDFLAGYYVLRRRFAIARVFAGRAIDSDMACDACYETLAEILFELGKLDDAVAAQTIALNLHPEGELRPGSLSRLRRYREAAAARSSEAVGVNGGPPSAPR